MVRYETLQAKNLLSRVTAPSMPFEWSLNPYRGCQHGCSFCYARSTHTFLGEAADDTFQNTIYMKSNAAQALNDQLAKMTLGGRRSLNGSIAIGTATDPYQQTEGKAGLTRSCLEVLAKYKADVTITTRSPLILRDVDLLKRMNSVSVNISVNTLDNGVWRNLEPSTPSPAKRIDTVRQLNEAGIRTSVFLAPIVPYLTDAEDDLENVIRSAAQAGAAYIMPSFLRLSTPEVKCWFFKCIGERYPHLSAKLARLYERSAYVSREYKQSVTKIVQVYFERYGVSEWDMSRKAETVAAPEQLTFHF
ncbi:SPL family radical SAM protein [Paenibacillus thermotolerans]|uniref:SPL family radical SAM protein n=1 Tax=Paenibacillus thermotolerans TaxID=3027807 RepID=UPI0023674D2E|nr:MULTISPECIES: radical SAM protein [unclassified Paenibacillus]